MPARGSYQIANREEGKAAERDQSYRSCLFALLIFFFLCIILIVACLPWKRGYGDTNKEEAHVLEEKQYNDYHTTTTARTTTVSTKLPEEFLHITDGHELFERYQNASDIPETTTEAGDSTEIVSSTTVNSTVLLFARILQDENITEPTTAQTEEDVQSQANETTEAFTTERLDDFVSHIVGILSRHDVEDNETWTTTTDFDETEVTSSDNVTSLPVLMDYDNSTEQTSTVMDTTTEGFTDALLNTTDVSIDEETDHTHFVSTTSTTEANENLTTSTEAVETTVYNATETTSTEAIETTVYNATETTSPTTQILTSTESHTEVDTLTPFTTTTTTTMKPVENEECMSGQCKQTAAKLLSRMNHSADPCDDFYEYACGGMEADPQMVDLDLAGQAYKRIEEQMVKQKSEKKLSVFSTYYDSCMDYERTVSLDERIQLVKSELDKIGKFYTSASWPTNYTGVTDLIAKMLLHNRPPLFDVVTDVDEYHRDILTLRIEPAPYKNNPLAVENTDDSCHASEAELKAHYVNLETLYNNYESCKNDTGKFVNSISEALNALGVFSDLNNTYNVSQYMRGTVINIDLEIIQGFFANYPSENEMRKAYLLKDYANISFTHLETESRLVNWTQLILLVTGLQVEPQAQIQVYFYDTLMKGFQNLEKFTQKSMMQLHNSLLGLFARNLYQDFVVARIRDPNTHCLRAATKLLAPEASRLYLSSFSKEELMRIRITTTTMFNTLKDTLSAKILSADWIDEPVQQIVLQKIRDLKLVIPTNIKFNDQWGSNVTESDLSGNYFENSMILMQRYRTRMYADLKIDRLDPKHIDHKVDLQIKLFSTAHVNPRRLAIVRGPLRVYTGLQRVNNMRFNHFISHSTTQFPSSWTHYATPYQSRATAIYSLNLIVVPLGSIDWSDLFKTDSATHGYLALATLGNVIARQIAHHFDANGIYYWNGTRGMYSLLSSGSASLAFDDYINCHRDTLYDHQINMTLQSTGQLVTFKISQLTLNERLSDAVGLRLAYDTLARRASMTEPTLPWLGLNINQLYYIAYAQMHCTKTPLASSYISLHENEQLPSRIRVQATAINDRLLGEAWECPVGSEIVPSDSCSVFPYLDFREHELSPV